MASKFWSLFSLCSLLYRYKGNTHIASGIGFSSKVIWSGDLRSIDFNYMIRLEIRLEIKPRGAITESVHHSR